MRPFSVSEFIEFLNTAISTAVFPEGACVEGEILEYRVSQGKWIWFKLKDEDSVISCFSTVWQLRTPLEDGMRVRVFGNPRVHAKSGKFSVNVERVEFVGEGALRRAFELMKEKLGKEGLFRAERKRPLPRFPERIGVIASRESAAFGDLVRILGNRWGGMDVRLFHVQVQGKDAVRDITRAFRYFNSLERPVDVLVLTRGGGSFDDLQAFNSEEVARAVYSSTAPVVVGVGHERDESLADYVADIRASTPSHAAELIAPDRGEFTAMVDGHVGRLAVMTEAMIEEMRLQTESGSARLEEYLRRSIDFFSHRMTEFARVFDAFASDTRSRLVAASSAAVTLLQTMAFRISGLKDDIVLKERMVRGLDPHRLLARGYSLVRHAGRIVRDARDVTVGARLDVQMYRGTLGAKVTDKKTADNLSKNKK